MKRLMSMRRAEKYGFKPKKAPVIQTTPNKA